MHLMHARGPSPSHGSDRLLDSQLLIGMLHVVCQKQLTTCWHVSPVELDLFLIDSADWIHAAASLVEADLNGVMYAVAQLADTNADFAGMISPCRCLHHSVCLKSLIHIPL